MTSIILTTVLVFLFFGYTYNSGSTVRTMLHEKLGFIDIVVISTVWAITVILVQILKGWW